MPFGTFMKRVIILAAIFCFCFSLAAAEGETEPGVEKKQKPYWTAENLAWGPFWLMGGVFCLTPFPTLYSLGRADDAAGAAKALFFWPTAGTFSLVYGAIHTATFGLLHDSHTGEDYVSKPFRKILGEKYIFSF
jgi:hypothetical protein